MISRSYWNQEVKCAIKYRSSAWNNKAKHQAQQWHQALKGVYTFDVAAREIPGTLTVHNSIKGRHEQH